MLILTSPTYFYLSCSHVDHWGTHCLLGRAAMISAHSVKNQGAASGEWSISSIDSVQIWEGMGSDSLICIILGRVRYGWNWVVMLWEFKPNICFCFFFLHICDLNREAFVLCQITAGTKNFSFCVLRQLHISFRNIQHRLRKGSFASPTTRSGTAAVNV